MLRSLKGLYHLLVSIFAVLWYGFPANKLTVVGVTGTDGKTTTTTLIYEICKKAGLKTSMITSVHAVIAGKSYDTGFHVTTPSAYHIQEYLREAVNHGDTHAILEVTSHALSQYRVFGIRFAVGVLTNVSHEHLDWHKTFERYLKTKTSLLQKSQTVVINRDDADSYAYIIPRVRNKKIMTYSIRRDAIVTPRTHRFTTLLPGQFNRYNCLAAIAASEALSILKERAIETIASFHGVPGRMEVITKKPCTVIVDFAHTPNALFQALRTVRIMAKRKRLIVVFGAASKRDTTKRPLMGKAASDYADVIVLTEEDSRREPTQKIIDAIRSGIPNDKQSHVVVLPDRAEAISYAIQNAQPGDWVLITGKGHEKSICRGRKEYPWSDQEEVKKNLKQLDYVTKN